ncbi:MAG: PfkB family carbohydrate kinase [Chloroflexota bacterium]
MHRVVVGGECLVDVITEPTGVVREVPGGGPYNTSRTIARLGGRVSFLGCVSRDRLGERLAGALAADGVDLSLVVRTDAPTTIAHATLDASGAASYRFDIEGTAAPMISTAHALDALDPTPSAIHVGTLGLVFEPSGTSLEALVRAASSETLVMLDPNARPSAIPDLAAWRARMGRLAARADIIRASADDLAVLRPGEPLDVARGLAAGGSVVLLSDGPRPVRVLAPGIEPLELPVPSLPVVDTVGAGDAFGGGFLAWWVQHRLSRDALADRGLLAEATTFALQVAAVTCGRAGADPPRLSELGMQPPMG